MISKVAVTLSLLSISATGFSSEHKKSETTSEIAEGDSIKNVIITDVVISANKERGQLSLLPISASVMKSTELKNRNVTNIKDFSLMIPNLFMPDYGTKLTSPIYIRGIGSRINSPSVGLYVDGVPYFEKSTFDFDFADVAMIEVLRGPQGTLYGRNTMGGIINVTTHSPLSYEGTHINLSTGNYDRLNSSVSHYQKINDNWGFSVTGNYLHNGGYFYNVTTDSKADKMNSGGGRIRLRYNKDKWDINLISNYEYSDQSGYPYMLVDTITHKPTEVDYNDKSFYRRELSSNGVIANFIHNKFIFTSRTSYQYYKGHQGIDQDFSPIDKYYINQHEKQNMISQELEFKNSKNEFIDWIGGIFGFYQGMDKQVAMQYKKEAKPANMLSDKYYENPSYGVSFFTQATANNLFIKNLALTLGARYDIEYSDMKYRYYTITESKGRV
ncbi:MAG: TonB-dependent receptor, partial [Bacteroidales bacterium]